VNEASDWNAVVQALGLPLIVKPGHEGSTIGLTKVCNVKDLPGAYELAARHDRMVLAEEFIDGRELTASILGDTALPLIRIDAPQGNYDYQNKYFTDETKYYCPAGITAAAEQAIRDIALQSFRLLGCEGWGRADLILRADGTFSFLEMNTSPGMTGHSLVPMAARQAGLSFPDLVERILGDAHVG
jgi:D-alanine-D-alanine ligase